MISVAVITVLTRKLRNSLGIIQKHILINPLEIGVFTLKFLIGLSHVIQFYSDSLHIVGKNLSLLQKLLVVCS